MHLSAGVLSNKNGQLEEAKDLNAAFGSAQDEVVCGASRNDEVI